MLGKRVDWDGTTILNELEYAKAPSGHWYCCTPGGHMGNLSGHSVTEHEDRTITVSPSILISSTDRTHQLWHGHLERGAWKTC